MATTVEACITEPGGPEKLELVERALGDPKPGHVLVESRALGLNYIDTYHRSGLYPLPSLPHALGVEAVGVVVQLGPPRMSVHSEERLGSRPPGSAPASSPPPASEPPFDALTVGERVAYATAGPGAHATRRWVPEDKLVRVPQELSDEVVAAVLLKGMTTEYLIRRTYPVSPGETVLLHAAAGGVGLLACQWLSHLGARVIGTVGSEEKAALARAHGCAEAILYESEDVPERVRELTEGKGVSVVYDSVGRSTWQASLESLRPRGTLVSFGNASGKPDPVDLLTLTQHGSLYVTRPTLADYTRSRRELTSCAGAVFEMVQSGALAPLIGQRYRLTDIRVAHEALESRETRGSTVILP